MLLNDQAIDLEQWRDDGERRPIDLERFVAHVRADHLPHAVLIVVPPVPMSRQYGAWRSKAFVITPNKRAPSSVLPAPSKQSKRRRALSVRDDRQCGVTDQTLRDRANR
jgi:aspartokinase/homoserine dehydrogenase 1